MMREGEDGGSANLGINVVMHCHKAKRVGPMILLPLLILLLGGCVSMSYESSQELPVTIDRNPSHNITMEVSGVKAFYLWGAIPERHTIWVDREFSQRWKLREVSGLEIVEGQTFLDSLVSIVSLGLVVPRTYYLKGYGK